MTKQEIIAEINAKIAGQGTNIDAGSALPGILQGIIDLIPDAPTPQVQANLLETDNKKPDFIKGPSILNVDREMPDALIEDMENVMKYYHYLFLEYDGAIYSRTIPTPDALFNNPASEILMIWGNQVQYSFGNGVPSMSAGSYIVLLYDEGPGEYHLKFGEI